jgi:hypothetical protein
MDRTSILDGVSVDQLRVRLAAMQQVYLDLTTGSKVQAASYTQGDGARTVTYSMTNIADLTQAILAVQSQIDSLTGACTNRRAPMRPVF